MSGDGTVPRVSALPIEYSDANIGMYSTTKHGSLQNGQAAMIQLEGVLSANLLDLGALRRKPTETSITIDVDDLFFDTEPVEIRARPSRENVLLQATLADSVTSAKVARKTLEPVGRWHVATFGPLPESSYSVRITGEHVLPADDSFAVG